MKICVVNLGDVCECFVSSSINKGLICKYDRPEITWVVKGEEQLSLFEYANGVKTVQSSTFLNSPVEEYDLLINLSPFVHPSDPSLKAKELVGFNFSEASSEYHEILYGKRKSSMNLFQVYYRLAGMTWRGEGYGISYYPKNRAKENTAAIAVNNAKLRHYVNDHLNMETFRFAMVPYKKNILKRMDELNRASHVITDDHLTMHLAVALRKYVHFLETVPLNSKPEFFGQGHIYQIDNKLVI